MANILSKLKAEGTLSTSRAKKLKKSWGATIAGENGVPIAVYIRKPEAIGHEWIHWMIDRTAKRGKKIPDRIYVMVEDQMRPYDVLPALRKLLTKRGYPQSDWTYEYLPWLFDMMTRPTKQFHSLFATEGDQHRWHEQAKKCMAAVKKWAEQLTEDNLR